jgi:hypothetical protein
MVFGLVGYLAPTTITPEYGHQVCAGALHPVTAYRLDPVVTQERHLFNLTVAAKAIPPHRKL